MGTLKQLTDDVLLSLYGYGAPAPRASFLTAGIDAVTLSITVSDGSDFGQGIVEIDNELIYVESVTGNTLTVASDGRGFYGTTAATHASGARVQVNPVWPRVRVEQAINEAIEGTHPVLYGIGTTSFVFNGTQTTYSLPADCEQVLVVTADTVGPTKEQQHINRYSVNLSAPTAEWVTGNTITLQQPVFPGRDVTVTYRKAPAPITTNDQFTVSGLRGTAVKAVRYAALSELVSHLDAARLSVDTAVADEFDERNAVGSASRVSAQLYARYEVELERERRRLATTTPVPINVRGR